MERFPLISVIAVSTAMVAGIGVTVASNLHEENLTCTVTNKESVSKENGHEYRVFTEECGVLSVQDNIFRLHFTSADVYGGLDAGTTYNVTTVGWRVPVFSWMPNIISAAPAR